MKPTALPASTATLASRSDLDRAILAASDGSRTVAEIASLAARALGQPVAPWQVHAALDALAQAGLVQPGVAPTASTAGRTLRALGAAAALLAIGVVPAHANDDDEAAEESSDEADDDEADDDDGKKKKKKDDAKEDKKKLTPAEAAQKSREESAKKRATKRKLDPKRQEERARKRLGPLR